MFIQKKYMLLVCGAVFAMSPFSAYSQTINMGGDDLKRIEVSRASLYPEDIKYNPITKKFILGSFREGAVYEIDMDGNARLLLSDDRLISVLGIQIDTKRNRIYLATSNLNSSIKTADNVKKFAGLGIYDLTTGAAIGFIDLGALLPEGSMHLANGITMDDDGNVYVTDSFSPVIYKITPDAQASVFLQNDALGGKGISLNGIAYHPDGYFIVAKKGDGVLVKIPKDSPESFSFIEIDQNFVGLDGVTFVNKNEIVIIANRSLGIDTNSAYSLYSDDGWTSAKVSGSYSFGNVYPTTATIKDRKIFAIHSKIGELVEAKPEDKGAMTEKAIIQQIGVIQ